MVGKCCVPNCRGNYDKANRVSVFHFPAEKEIRNKWLTAICREKYVPTKNSVVCELHFTSSDIMRETVFYSEDGQQIPLRIEKPRLAPGAVPSILPNCPEYLSKKTTRRENPEEKRRKRECQQLQLAIVESAAEYTDFVSSREFATFEELKTKLNLVTLGNFWNIIEKENCIAFLNVNFCPYPKIVCSVQISNTLNLCVHIKDVKVDSFKGFSVPNSVHSIDVLNTVLQRVEDYINCGRNEESVKNVLLLILELLKSVDVERGTPLEKPLLFITEQVEVLLTKVRKYSPCFLIFYALVHSISPHCYRYMRSSCFIILPHESTIRKFCTSFGYAPHLEQSKEQFLGYISSKFSNLEDDKYVILMMDEVHIKPTMDYKGGNMVGGAYSSDSLANGAYCFMVSSLLSSFKEVVHIVAVKTLTGEQLHCIVKNVIVGLERIGFRVICVVSDNNGINRKSMQFFSKDNQLTFKYEHPCDSNRPLFFIIDSVHILKNIRGNWLKQKDKELCFKFPNFDLKNDEGLQGASFQSVRKLHSLERGKLVKYSYGLTLKALYPSSFECQNVKLVLQIFNENIVEGLNGLGKKEHLPYYEGTAKFIKIIQNWWCVVNVKTPFKGIRKNSELMKPIFNDIKDERVSYLNSFLAWLQQWKSLKLKECLTNETMNAIIQTTAGLLELQEYCFQSLNFKYFLTGKIQTDMLEDRFGKYRQLAGGQYNISLRQLYEVEHKIRLQSSLPNKLSLKYLGDISIEQNTVCSSKPVNVSSYDTCKFLEQMIFSDEDAETCQDDLPILLYIAGYACFTVLKKLQCCSCREIIVDNDHQSDDSMHLITSKSRGGLLAPNIVVSNIILYNYLVVSKLTNELEKDFLNVSNQREIVLNITMSVVDSMELLWEPNACDNGHTAEYLCKKLLWISTNVFLNNYCKKRNSTIMNPLKRKKVVFTRSEQK